MEPEVVRGREAIVTHRHYSRDAIPIPERVYFHPERESLAVFLVRARPSDAALGYETSWIQLESEHEYYIEAAR